MNRIRTIEQIEKEISDYVKSILEKYQNSFIDFSSFRKDIFNEEILHKMIYRFNFDIFINSKLKYCISFDLYTSTVAYFTIWEEHKTKNSEENKIVLHKEFFIIYPRWNYNASHKKDRKPVFLEKFVTDKEINNDDYDERVLTFLKESEIVYNNIIKKQKVRKKKKELKMKKL